jgi:hypothetical protein
VPVCFFVALGLYKLVELARSSALFGVRNSLVMAAGVALFAGISLKTYFMDYSPQRIAGGLNAEIATELRPVLAKIGPGYDAYFAGAPGMFWGFPTLHYPSAPMPGTDILEPLTAPPPRGMVPSGRGAAFIFLPHRLPELHLVRAAFPGGEVREVYSPAQRNVIVTVYSIPPSQDASP